MALLLTDIRIEFERRCFYLSGLKQSQTDQVLRFDYEIQEFALQVAVGFKLL